MIWHKATLSAMILASMAVDSTAQPSKENVDVIILGAGAAGASAARQLEMHNDDNPNKKISYYVLEAKNRVGGRIMDRPIGAELPPSRYSGGYESKDPNGGVWTSAPPNEGCKCRGIDCPNFKVEMGMGWFQGTKGIDIESCPAGPQKQGIDLSTQLREEKLELDGHWKTALYLGKHQGDGVQAAAQKKIDCDKCPDVYNKHFAISQGKAPPNHGNLEDPLKVHCAGEGGMSGDKYSFLKEGHYYGKNARGQIEMKKIKFEKELPGFNNKRFKPGEFLYKFDQMMIKCVDYQAYQFYNQWYYHAYYSEECGDEYGRDSTPFYTWRANEINKISWKDFDKGFHNMPDINPFHAEALRSWNMTDIPDNGWERVDYCNNKFHKMVKKFLKKNDEISLNGKKLYNWYKNFDRFSSFLDGQDISFMNFGDDGTSPLGYEHAFSIDQRGLKTVVESVMPKNNRLKLKHKVKKVQWKQAAICSKQYPVLVTVKEKGKKGQKRYCAKKVISTVSHGALAEPNKKINPFTPKISVAKSPFKSESGDLIKLYFRFPEKFWNSEDGTASDYISFMMEENFKINKSEGKVRGEYFYNLDRWYRNLCDPNNPDKFCDTRSLFTFLTSHELKVMGLHDNNVSDQEFSDKIWYILEPLRQQYGDQFLEPDCWQFHDWKKDPQFRGAYGVWKLGSTYIDHQDFFQPRKNNEGEEVLWLSGEASCLYQWGTNEGAYEAGARDAKRVINSLLGIDEVVFSLCDAEREYEHCSLDGKDEGNVVEGENSCLEAITPDWSWL